MFSKNSQLGSLLLFSREIGHFLVGTLEAKRNFQTLQTVEKKSVQTTHTTPHNYPDLRQRYDQTIQTVGGVQIGLGRFYVVP